VSMPAPRWMVSATLDAAPYENRSSPAFALEDVVAVAAIQGVVAEPAADGVAPPYPGLRRAHCRPPRR